MSQPPTPTKLRKVVLEALNNTLGCVQRHAQEKRETAQTYYLDEWSAAFEALTDQRAEDDKVREQCVVILNVAAQSVDATVLGRCFDDMRGVLEPLNAIYAWQQPLPTPRMGVYPAEERPDGTLRYVIAGATKGLTEAVQHLDSLSHTFELRMREFIENWGTWFGTSNSEVEEPAKGSSADNEPASQVRPKKSVAPGEAAAKLVAALTKYHKYADGGALNHEPIGNSALARLAGVDKGSATGFFKREFRGHDNYERVCRDTALLVNALALLNGEVKPKALLGDGAQNVADD